MANMSFANNAATTLASGINTSVTSLTVASGTGTLFPTLTGSQYFYCTLESVAGTSREIVKVTARSTDTFTIARGQDGTTGTAFSTGDKVELRLVRANLTDFALLDEVNTFSQQQTFSSGIKFSDATTQTTAPLIIPGVFGQAFTSNGTFTIPAGVTALKVTAVGGGGGGGGGGSGGTGGTGGTTSFGAYCTATGGVGGGNGNSAGPAGAGGSGTGTIIVVGDMGNAASHATNTGQSIGFKKGAGGGGAAATCCTGAGGPGGSGGVSITYITGLIPAGTVTVTVGAAGTAGSAGGYGANAGLVGYIGFLLVEW